MSAAPLLTVLLKKVEDVPGAEAASDQVLSSVTWGDAKAETTVPVYTLYKHSQPLVGAGADETEIMEDVHAIMPGTSLPLLPPDGGLDAEQLKRAVSMYPYLVIDVSLAGPVVGHTLCARLLLPLLSIKSTQLDGPFTFGAPPGVVATSSDGFGTLHATLDISPDLLAAIVATTADVAVASEDADRLESLGQFSVQPSAQSTHQVLIPGHELAELVIQGIHAEVSGFKHAVSIWLVTSQLLVLDKHAAGGADLTMPIPRGCITKVSFSNDAQSRLSSRDLTNATTATLTLDCKDFRVVKFTAASPETIAQLAALHGRISQWTAQLGEERAALMGSAIEKWGATTATVSDTICPAGTWDLTWELDMSAEFDRQLGGSWQDDASEFRDGGNSEFTVCDTYPSLVLVPKRASAELIAASAKFRSKKRLPCLSWYSPSASIYRCAQPMTGIMDSHSPEDEDFVGMCRQVGGEGKLLTIFDCRSHSAAAANSLKGAGLEDPARYVQCQRVFLDIGNIHAMRHSLDALMDLIVSDVQDFDDHEDNWLPRLSASGWLGHIRLVLGSALEVALVVHDGAHALVHCSDGWDRTSQICALAQLLQDPFFRTIDGFRVLIQKDFVGFGHMCRKRLGTVTHQVSFQWKNSDFLSRNPDLLSGTLISY